VPTGLGSEPIVAEYAAATSVAGSRTDTRVRDPSRTPQNDPLRNPPGTLEPACTEDAHCE
jgi:hypothetical protein